MLCSAALKPTRNTWERFLTHLRRLQPVWQKLELAFQARRNYANPYTGPTVWVDLEGSGFHKHVYGFWDGGHTFRARLLATAPGLWRWRSGSAPA